MKIAVISDIHANLQALEAVLEDIRETGVDEVWCLGDAVGYGANPNEVLEILADTCSTCLIGNHDLAALGEIDISIFSTSAAEAALWTRRFLTDQSTDFLRSLGGASGEREGVGLFHGSPRDPVWEYVLDTELAEDCLSIQPTRIGLIGHSHLALYFTRADELSRTTAEQAPEGTSLNLSRGQWLLNPGSVGQPRDGDPRAAWMELDTGNLEVTYRRSEYQIDEASAAIREAGLPPNLADRLTTGH
jgi:predicted phosphodiesterase